MNTKPPRIGKATIPGRAESLNKKLFDAYKSQQSKDPDFIYVEEPSNS